MERLYFILQDREMNGLSIADFWRENHVSDSDEVVSVDLGERRPRAESLEEIEAAVQRSLLASTDQVPDPISPPSGYH